MLKQSIKKVLAIIPANYRQHPSYKKTKRLIKRSMNWSPEELEKNRLIQLRRMIYLAYNNTSGYRQLYKEAGIQPSDIQKLSDLKNLPMVNKELLRDNIDSFSVLGSNHKYNSTGGTTGEPFGFYLSRSIFAKEAAFMHTYWNQFGWNLGDKSVVLRGSYVGSNDHFIKYDAYTKELAFSASHLTPDNLSAFVEAYKKQGSPSFIQAYPSALSLFCDLIDENNNKDFSFKTIFLGSENIYSWQIEKFKKTFPNSKIHSWYGHAEKACFANLIPGSHLKYEVQPMYGVAEKGPLNENGMNEIIATGFINTSTPFIRYQTSDFAQFSNEPTEGTLYKQTTIFEKIDGRLQEVIVTKTDKYISMTSMSIHGGLFDNIKQFQFHQSIPGEVNLNIIPNQKFNESELDHIQTTLVQKFNNDLHFNLNIVDEIKKTHRGKMRYLIQDLDIKYSLES